MMVDDYHRDLSAKLVEGLDHLLGDRGREALERLVEQEQSHVAEECAGNCDHLLFAARQKIRWRSPALAELRKKLNDFFLVPMHSRAGAPPETPKFQILRDRPAGEQAAALRDVTDPVSRDNVGGLAGHIDAVNPDSARCGGHDSDPGF